MSHAGVEGGAGDAIEPLRVASLHFATSFRLHELWVDERRECIDDMNRILANAILNVACNE